MKQLLWLKFYPKDWNGDHELRRCSLAARGFLASMLEPMHKAEPYGHLLLRGKAPDYVELADIASCSLREVKYAIEELLKTGALSTTPDGIIYSRRMVRDAERRTKRALDGKLGGNPQLTPIKTLQVVTGTEVNQQVNAHVKAIETRGQRLEAKSRTAPAEKTPSPAKEFLAWFQTEYKAQRHGATYFISWDKHMPIVGRLLKLHDPQRLRKHAHILLTTNEPWTETTDRGIEVLAGKINWLEERLCAWEVKRKAREAV